MTNYQDIAAMLSGKPTVKTPTLAASVRIAVPLLATITVMANRANISRNEMFGKLLAASVNDTFEAMIEADPVVVADIQAEATDLAASWMDESFPEEEEE